MALYLIQHRIKTTAICQEPFDFDGFHFEHYEFNLRQGWLTDYWLVTQEIEGETWNEAINAFRQKLSELLPKIAFVSQCSLEFLLEPFMVLNLDYKDKIVFIQHTKDLESVGLHFAENEISSLEKLSQSAVENGFFDFMVESANASTFQGSLSALFGAVENLAQGDRTIRCENCGHEKIIAGANAELLKEIVGGDLYNKCWGKDGIRHKLSHGKLPTIPDGLKQEIYDKIVSFLNKKTGATINQDVVDPQRGFTGLKQHALNFYKYFSDIKDVDFKGYCVILDTDIKGEKGILEHVGTEPHRTEY